MRSLPLLTEQAGAKFLNHDIKQVRIKQLRKTGQYTE